MQRVGDPQSIIHATFARPGTDISRQRPVGLSEDFISDEQNAQQWNAYIASVDLEGPNPHLEQLLK